MKRGKRQDWQPFDHRYQIIVSEADHERSAAENLRIEQQIQNQWDATWKLLSQKLKLDSEDSGNGLIRAAGPFADERIVETLLKSNRREHPDNCFFGTEQLVGFATTDHDCLRYKTPDGRGLLPGGGGLYIFTDLATGTFLKVGESGKFRKRIHDHFHLWPSRLKRTRHEVANYCYAEECKKNPDSHDVKWRDFLHDNQVTLLLQPVNCNKKYWRMALEAVLLRNLCPVMEQP